MTLPVSLNKPIDNDAFEEVLKNELFVRNTNASSYSEKLDYRIQHSIFTYVDKTVEKTKCLRLLAFTAIGLSSLTYLSTQIASILELTIHGLGLILSSGPSSENRERGWILLKRVPWEIVTLFPCFPLALIACVFWTCINPKACITSMCEAVKVPLRHEESFAWAQEKLKMLDIDLSAEMKTMKKPKEYEKLPVQQLI